MSVYQARSSLLTLAPRVWIEAGRLHVRTNFLLRLLTLFGYTRTVIIDPARKFVELQTRRFWLWKHKRRIPFERIEHLDYRYAGLSTSWNILGDTTDALDTFTIELVLIGGERVPVTSYRGEGSRMTGWTGALFGDDLVDWSGNQEDASRSLVDVLTKMLDVPLGPRLLSQGKVSIVVCAKCNRHLSGEAVCPMCGGRAKIVKV